MLEIIIMAFSIALAVITAVWSGFIIYKVLRLKKKFNEAVVLVPLYKRSKWTHFSVILLGVCLIADIVFMAVLKAYLVCGCLLVVIISLTALLILMITLRCAVLDKGIVMPYKFIDWSIFYDYAIDGDTICFCGDKKGFDTIFSASTRLTFDESYKEKLIQILEQYKTNK